jgi:spore photoproduct lyase
VIKTFDTLYIHPELKDHVRARQLVRTIPHRRLKELKEIEELAARQKEEPAKAVRRGKFNVALSPYKGRIVEDCPASRGMRCCRYRVINLISGCPIDCSYCILQGYLNRPTIFIYPELEKIFAEVDAELAADWEYPPRYGTGELSDSLALDHITGFSRDLVEFFGSRQKNWFEFKTKSTCVDNLCELAPPPPNILVSWSVNPQVVIDTEESGAPGLDQRLSAAARVQDAGYHLGFHFDPIFYFSGWEEAYREVVEKIYQVARPDKIAWISLGCLRFSPWMAPYFTERFAGHPLLAGEFFPVPPDGKYRYPQPVRIEIYRKVYEWIRSFDKQVYVYLCMESAAVYRWALGREVEDDWLAVEKGFPRPPG